MDDFLSSGLGLWSLIVVPGMLLAFIANALVAKRLRGAAGTALLGVLLIVLFFAVLSGGSIWGLREYVLNSMIPQCEAEQQAAFESGEALLLDCESSGLIVIFPMLIGAVGLMFGLIGAGLIRFTRKR